MPSQKKIIAEWAQLVPALSIVTQHLYEINFIYSVFVYGVQYNKYYYHNHHHCLKYPKLSPPNFLFYFITGIIIEFTSNIIIAYCLLILPLDLDPDPDLDLDQSQFSLIQFNSVQFCLDLS
ncbi:hypothetical protein J3Q64DRAFT_1697431 [Phycomyces blakesleeanus]|uniref:Fatty acid hydroxylase domain-containing protein n=1 Tax=Phycomyces blakesleeanus TaxID=4837 RepID=A0ABR3B1M4_PHYBL